MAEEFCEVKRIRQIPRLPLEGSIDLTYRCNNDCRHCWLKVPSTKEEEKKELSFEEIIRVVDEARGLGCREWYISGGEPILRPDFPEIFDYITGKAYRYTLNTNGTLITPRIAKLMKRKGVKLISLYGATKEIHDYITRRPGSFDELMQGLAYLKEAGAGFMLQLVPMRANYHQFKKMIEFSRSFSKHYRIGASWLYLSANADARKNKEILAQRLLPSQLIALSKPTISTDSIVVAGCSPVGRNGHFFSSCIASLREFHIDAYGKMSFCAFVKDPVLRYDLGKGAVGECWEDFIPSLAAKLLVTGAYKRGCGSCCLGTECNWCSVYSYLEHRRHGEKVEYLCGIARASQRYRKSWIKTHRKFFRIADITIQIDSDLPIKKNTFHPKLKAFTASGPDHDTVVLRHHFALPELAGKDLGQQVYRKPPWAIYKKNDSWIYLGISPQKGERDLHRIAVFNRNHTRAEIYNKESKGFLKGGLSSLTLFSTDQILLARLLAERQGCFLHACGIKYKGRGFLFVGHSGAGKSTIAKRAGRQATILCDDRIIVRRVENSFRVYGTWSHGEVKDISGQSAPLKAILFIKKSESDKITLLEDKKIVTRNLLACLIKPLAGTDWWEKTLGLIEPFARDVPSFELRFKKHGSIASLLQSIC